MQRGVKVNIALIIVFILSVLLLFINNLTTPRTLSNQELLVNGLFLFQEPKEISDFSFESSNKEIFTKSNLMGKFSKKRIIANQVQRGGEPRHAAAGRPGPARIPAGGRRPISDAPENQLSRL